MTSNQNYSVNTMASDAKAGATKMVDQAKDKVHCATRPTADELDKAELHASTEPGLAEQAKAKLHAATTSSDTSTVRSTAAPPLL
jgi:hypothetical protein